MGLCGNTFKERWRNHDSNFNGKGKGTALSTYVKKLKKENVKFEIKWKFIEKAKKYSQSAKICFLCTTEKWYIIFRPDLATLNSRDEWGSHCRHKQQLLL